MKQIRPIGHWILAEEHDKIIKEQDNGLHLKDNLDARLVKANILAFGSKAPTDLVKENDEIIAPRDGVLTASLFGRKYVFTPYNMILGVIEDVEESKDQNK